jgi:cytochrome c-type biogenesis protein
MEFAAITGALWLGILTAISPCPLATNTAALSYLAKQVTEPRRVLWGGAAYTLGRIFTYTLLAALLVSGLLSVPSVSFFLQKHLNQLMGPILVLTGAALLGLLPLPSISWGGGDRIQKFASSGVPGAFVMGAFFALALCPVSAALFFGGLLPLALKHGSKVVLPAVYGLGTALPVAALAVAVALGIKKAAGAFNRMTVAEKWMRLLTGWLFIGFGTYMTVMNLFLAP